MKLDLAARREALLLERETISQKMKVQCANHAKVCAAHEKIIDSLQNDLRVIDARLEMIEECAAALGPDFSGRAPIAGGPVEPIRRRPKRDLLALTMDYVQKYPGNTADWIALTIEETTSIRTPPQPILNKLEHLKESGNVRREKAGVSEDDDTWWPTTETFAQRHQRGLEGIAKEIDGRHGNPTPNS